MPSDFHTQTPINTETILTVSALNLAVSQLLERNIPLTWISGEISNFTRASSGHWYFTLKDSAAQVRAVMFRGRAQYASFSPREGDKVEVRALVGLYTPRGDYQINVEAIRRAGVGNLYEAFLQLKATLAQEGLFDPQRKRTIPVFVKRIGIVTSPNAAALSDVLSALRRRAPHVEIILYPCPVQGEGAGVKIAQAIATASARNECDVLLICRGGGSIEDLWAFNEEIVARTIAHCSLPVISGVGHETDFTIADFVADVRAPTPTAAAELASIPRADWLHTITQLQHTMQRHWQRKLATHTQTLDWTTRRLISPRAAINLKHNQLDDAAQRLRLASKVPIQHASSLLKLGQTRLMQKRPNIKQMQQQLHLLQTRNDRALQAQVQRRSAALDVLTAQLAMLNPQKTLERGYAIVSDAEGKIIRKGHLITAPSALTIRTAHDITQVQVSEVLAQSTLPN